GARSGGGGVLRGGGGRGGGSVEGTPVGGVPDRGGQGRVPPLRDRRADQARDGAPRRCARRERGHPPVAAVAQAAVRDPRRAEGRGAPRSGGAVRPSASRGSDRLLTADLFTVASPES